MAPACGSCGWGGPVPGSPRSYPEGQGHTSTGPGREGELAALSAEFVTVSKWPGPVEPLV